MEPLLTCPLLPAIPRNEPWDITLKQKGEFKPIDYMLAINSDIVSLPYEEAKERVQERSEMVEIFGAG